jgi:hypothetical protein
LRRAGSLQAQLAPESDTFQSPSIKPSEMPKLSRKWKECVKALSAG